MFAEEEKPGYMAFIVNLVPPLYFQDKQETQHPSGVWGGSLQNALQLLFSI